MKELSNIISYYLIGVYVIHICPCIQIVFHKTDITIPCGIPKITTRHFFDLPISSSDRFAFAPSSKASLWWLRWKKMLQQADKKKLMKDNQKLDAVLVMLKEVKAQVQELHELQGSCPC